MSQWTVQPLAFGSPRSEPPEPISDRHDILSASTYPESPTMIAGLALEMDSDQKQRSASLEIEASAVDIAVGMEEQFAMFTTASNCEEAPPSISDDDRLSSAKFVLVTLVVLGHFIEAYSKAGNQLATIIMHLIYSFHVPAFVLISGYYSKDLTPARRRKLLSGLVLPYVILQPLFCVAYAGLFCVSDGSETQDGMMTRNWSLGDGDWNYFYPFAHLWYLISLLSMRIWLPFALEMKYTVAFHMILGCLVGYNDSFDGRFLSIHRTVVLLPYFIAGRLLEESRTLLRPVGIKLKCTAFFFVLVQVAGSVLASQADMPLDIWFRADSYTEVLGEYSSYGGLVQLGCYVWTTMCLASFFTILHRATEEKKTRYISISVGQVDGSRDQRDRAKSSWRDRLVLKLAFWGRQSMYIYILHMAVLMLMAKFGYYDGLLDIIESDEVGITVQVVGTSMLAVLVSVLLTLNLVVPTIFKCLIEPDVGKFIFRTRNTLVESESSASLVM